MTATPAAVLLTLDWWPANLKPNGPRGNPVAHNAIAQAYRESIRKLARSQAMEQAEAQGFRLPLPAPVVAELTFAVPTRQDRDLDNCLAAFKHGIDGIVAAGIIESDSCWTLTAIDLRAAYEPALRVPEVRVRLAVRR